VKRIGVVLGGLALAGVLLAFYLVRRTFPRESGSVRLAGLSAPVSIATDGRGVPRIRAGSIPDAFFGLGYAHAKDRLWQMEFQRRVGSGRLAEILGNKLVPADGFLRTIGFRRAAEEAWRVAAPGARELLEAYSRGVNAYLETSPARSIEFRILRVSPEPWQPADSLVWAKMMAWDLAGNARDEIRRARFVAAVGRQKASELLPLAAAEPAILSEEEWPGRSPSGGFQVSSFKFQVDWPRLDSAFDSLAALGFGGGESLGSNSWVLAGSRTASGRPILANDPHLGLRVPSVWYLAAIDAPGFSAVGATLPGVPAVIIGHNDRIAWGLTSLAPDVQDLFVEQVDPADPRRYRHRGEWKTFRRRTERIRVRSGADVDLTVRESVHGPIVTDVFEGAGGLGAAVALRWSGLDPEDHAAEAFVAIDRSRGWNEFLAAVRLLRSLAQNFVYADVDGHIGYAASGAMPIRPRSDGLLPVSGAGEDDWRGFIPADALPRVLDPPKGFIVTANNRVASGAPLGAFGLTWAEPYRAIRIRQMIDAKPRLSVSDVAAMQLDRRSLQAEELLPLLLRTAPLDAPSRDALERLRGWNREMAPESVPASIYAAWFVELAKMPEGRLRGVPRGSTLGRFLIDALRGNSSWCDDVRTPGVETCGELQAATLQRAVAFLRSRLGPDPAAWRWERLHAARFPHNVFDGVRWLRPWFSLEVGQGGDASTVNVGAFRQDGSFAMTDGPSYRQIVDLADLPRSRYVFTTGQSGNVFDGRYRDLLPEWREGRTLEIGSGAPAKVLLLEPR